MFDEEGQKVLEDTQKQSDLGQKYELEDEEHSGINVAKVKEILKAEDKFDKELAKEKRKGKKINALKIYDYVVHNIFFSWNEKTNQFS